jgi:hypothetical protein
MGTLVHYEQSVRERAVFGPAFIHLARSPLRAFLISFFVAVPQGRTHAPQYFFSSSLSLLSLKPPESILSRWHTSKIVFC